MEKGYERIHQPELRNNVVSAEEAASWIQDGMTLGLSGFTRAGDAKAIPFALVDRAKTDPLKVNVYTGASLGSDVDKLFAEAGILNKRLPFQADATMRKKLNDGEFYFVDQHLSHTSEMLRQGTLDKIDYAIVEAVSISEDGMIIPSTSIGNSAIFVEYADNVLIELNVAQPTSLEGVHDLFH